MGYQDGSVDCVDCRHPLEGHTRPGGCRACRCVVRYSTVEVATLRINTGLPGAFDPEEYR